MAIHAKTNGSGSSEVDLTIVNARFTNIENKLNQLNNSLVVKGIYDTYSNMIEDITEPKNGWFVVVKQDENYNNTQTQYFYYDKEWVFLGGSICNIELPEFIAGDNINIEVDSKNNTITISIKDLNVKSQYEQYDNIESFPKIGENEILYLDTATNILYRWDGIKYVPVSSVNSIELGETEDKAYYGNKGKIAYDHSQEKGNPHNTQAKDISLNIEDFLIEGNLDITVENIQELAKRVHSLSINTIEVYENVDSFPTIGYNNKLYVSKVDNILYRWDNENSTYIPVFTMTEVVNYNDITNKPAINGITLQGNRTLNDLGIQPKGDYLTEESLENKLENYVPITRTINGKVLNNNIILNKNDIGLGNVANEQQIPMSQKGTAGGVAELDENGKVLISQLPSYVSDIKEFESIELFPEIGESEKLYIDITTNKTYRWTGTQYVDVGSANGSLALGETSATAYRGDRGKIAYDHSQTTGNPHGTTKEDIGLENVDNTSDLDKPISIATQAELDKKIESVNEIFPNEDGNVTLTADDIEVDSNKFTKNLMSSDVKTVQDLVNFIDAWEVSSSGSQTSVNPPYIGNFIISSWTEINGNYSLTYTPAIHGQGSTKALFVQVYESGDVNENVYLSYTVSNTGTVVVQSNQAFNGFVLISNLSGGNVTGESVPNGGKAGQFLGKITNKDGDADWKNIKDTDIKVTASVLNSNTLDEALIKLFTYANDVKSRVADVIGYPVVATQDSETIKNVIQTLKNLMIEYLQQKGINGISNENTLEDLILTIPNISQSINTNLQQTKLNVTAPYTYNIQLDYPIPTKNVCASLIKYVHGTSGVVSYNLDFNAGDSGHFEKNDMIEFDGTAHLKTNYSYTLSKLNSGIGYIIYESDDIDILQFNYIGNHLALPVRDIVNIKAIPHAQILIPIGSANLTGIEKVTSIKLEVNTNNNGMCLSALSFDDGQTYNVYNTNTNEWEVIDITNLEEFLSKGMNKTIVDSLTEIEIEKLRMGNTKFRCAYLIKQEDLTDIAEIDNIKVIVEMLGYDTLADNSVYKLLYNEETGVITFNVLVDGTYTFNILNYT